MLGPINLRQVKSQIRLWLDEDMPFGDITSQNIIECDKEIEAQLIAKEKGLICGLELIQLVYLEIDASVTLLTDYKDGYAINSGDLIGTLSGPLVAILMGERLALNLLQRLSGIASMSRQYADLIHDLPTIIVDTRKTTPGLRSLEKYAVRIGGCANHRYSLSDAVMIKDNHIKAAGNIESAVKQIRAHIPHTTKIEVEVESLDDFIIALDLDVDIIMLDNMSLSMMSEAVKLNKKKITLEASGNMTLDRIREVAQTGVDIISVGALTHSVSSLDISLKFLTQ